MNSDHKLFGGIIYKDNSGSHDSSFGGFDLIKVKHSIKDFFITQNLSDFPFASGHISQNKIDLLKAKYTDNQSTVINGKWSIVDYDRTLGKLFLVRDILGICPLYYVCNDELFAFSNRIQFLLDVPNINKSINKKSLVSFLLYNEIDRKADTLISSIKEVLPSQCISFNLNSFNIASYIYFSSKTGYNFLDNDYYKNVNYNRKSVDSFIQERCSHFDSDARHAILLSGGLDSSCLAINLASSVSINTSMYTMSYPDHHDIDETEWAQHIAVKYPQKNWIRVTTTKEEFRSNVEELHSIIEFPTFSTGTFNQFKLLSKCQEDGINIAWDGLGADALYGGHDYYRHLLLFHFLKAFKLFLAFELLGWRGHGFRDLIDSIKTYIKSIPISNTGLKRLKHRLKEDLSLYNRDFLEFGLNEYNKDLNIWPIDVKKLINQDFFNGVRHLSRFSDRLAAHFDVDMIYPYSENVELAISVSRLPLDKLFKNGMSKAILRDSFKTELPEEIYNRKDKKGMQSPNNLWIEAYKNDWIDYFNEELDEIYDLNYLKKNYSTLWDIGKKSESYNQFKHISFVIWREVFKLR